MIPVMTVSRRIVLCVLAVAAAARLAGAVGGLAIRNYHRSGGSECSTNLRKAGLCDWTLTSWGIYRRWAFPLILFVALAVLAVGLMFGKNRYRGKACSAA